MTRTVIGPNAAIRYLKAYQAHVDYWQPLNPAVMLVYVDKPLHTPYIFEYAANFPNSLIVARVRHELDGGFHLAPTGKDDHREYVASPIDYHNQFGFLGRVENGILNVLNEPDGFADDATIERLVRWMTDYIQIAAKAGTKSVLFNWADRNPRIIGGLMDGRFDNILTMMAHYPDLFFMGMHFYGPDIISEHLKSYVDRCAKLSIKPPRVIGSEFGIDSTGGLERGYKTRKDYADGDKYSRWQNQQVNGDLAPYFQSGVLIGLTLFQEGNSGGWDDMDFENDSAFKAENRRAVLAGELDVKPVEIPPIPKKDIVFGQKYRVSKPGDVIKAYLLPYGNDPLTVRTIPSGAVVTVLDKSTTSGETWLKISYANFTGVYYIQADLIDIKATMETPIVKPDPVPTPAPAQAEPKLNPTQIQMLYQWRDKAKAEYDLVINLIKLAEGITA